MTSGSASPGTEADSRAVPLLARGVRSGCSEIRTFEALDHQPHLQYGELENSTQSSLPLLVDWCAGLVQASAQGSISFPRDL